MARGRGINDELYHNDGDAKGGDTRPLPPLTAKGFACRRLGLSYSEPEATIYNASSWVRHL